MITIYLHTKNMSGYYHITSAALKTRLIFEKDEDFITGVNDIALCVLKFNIKILAFCLMSNHFHFVLQGVRENCVSFAEEYKRILSMRMRDRRGEVGLMKSVGIHIDELSDTEYLLNAIAYVLRNPLAARMMIMPYSYRWSSVGVYFQGANIDRGIMLKDLSFRKRIQILKSRQSVPDEYAIDKYGMILPSCFVDFNRVESLFRYPSMFLSALARKVETELELKTGIADRITMTDRELASEVNKLVAAEYGVMTIAQLSKEDRVRLCRLLRRNFGVVAKQIARVLHIPKDVVDAVI